MSSVFQGMEKSMRETKLKFMPIFEKHNESNLITSTILEIQCDN